MKQVLVAIVIIFSLSSCLKVLTTHTQVMDTYKNKAAVIARFGQPTEEIQREGMEEWIYNFGKINKKTTTEETTTSANINYADNAAYKTGDGGSVGSTISDKYKKYVEFTFDSSGEVKKWDSKRVNYTKTGPNKKATTWFISITVVVLGLIVYGLSNLAVVQ
jgi:hypothetical protein